MRRVVKPLCFVLGILPFLYCLWQIYLYSRGLNHDLSADPGKAIVHYNGTTALILLLVTLGITPLWKLLGLNLVYLRRMVGLFVFFYACVHLSAYLVFLLELNFGGFVKDVIKRPYITVGMLAFTGLIPLAITSNRWSQQKLRRNWKRLHRIIYPIAIFVMIHIIWQVRSDFTEALMYSALLSLLLGYRVAVFLRNR